MATLYDHRRQEGTGRRLCVVYRILEFVNGTLSHPRQSEVMVIGMKMICKVAVAMSIPTTQMATKESRTATAKRMLNTYPCGVRRRKNAGEGWPAPLSEGSIDPTMKVCGVQNHGKLATQTNQRPQNNLRNKPLQCCKGIHRGTMTWSHSLNRNLLNRLQAIHEVSRTR